MAATPRSSRLARKGERGCQPWWGWMSAWTRWQSASCWKTAASRWGAGRSPTPGQEPRHWARGWRSWPSSMGSTPSASAWRRPGSTGFLWLRHSPPHRRSPPISRRSMRSTPSWCTTSVGTTAPCPRPIGRTRLSSPSGSASAASCLLPSSSICAMPPCSGSPGTGCTWPRRWPARRATS